MKKTFFILAATLLACSFISCSKDGGEEEEVSGQTKEAYIDATSKTTWYYYSFSGNKVVGSADESEENNAVWAARKDWDIAIQRYNIRTNSGEFTTASAQGGVHTLAANTTFSSVLKVPANAQFATDMTITSEGMTGTTTVIRSEATVILFKTNEDGSTVMPPVYLPAPVYIFRTADGNSYYKVQFTQYVNDESVTGHVKFNQALISKE